MSKKIGKSVGVACISMLFQLGLSSQTAAQTSPQDIVKKLFTSSSPTNTDLTVVKESSGSRTKSDVKSETGKNTISSEPRVSLKNPQLDLKVYARETKLNELSFAGPDIEAMGEPQTFRATAYALRGRTRSGAYVRRGVIAADPRVLPLGSVVQLKAGKYTGVYTVHDTGKRIKGNIIDVWVPTNGEARQFGRQKIKLHVLRLGAKSRVKAQ